MVVLTTGYHRTEIAGDHEFGTFIEGISFRGEGFEECRGEATCRYRNR